MGLSLFSAFQHNFCFEPPFPRVAGKVSSWSFRVFPKVSTALAMVLESCSLPACRVGASSGPPLLEWTAAELSTLLVHEAPSVWCSSLLCLPHRGHGTLSSFCLLRPEITNGKPRGHICPANMFLFGFDFSLSN